MLRDAWRLSAGTLTALPWRAPLRVGRPEARWAMLLGPLAVLPLGVMVAALGLLGTQLRLPPAAVALLAVGCLALATRCLHWDGLADVADGLTASYDRERSLAVMKTGTSGPAGVVAIVLVVGLQVAGLTPLLTTTHGCLTAGVAVCLSRAALAVACARLVPSARPDGLGAVVVGTVPLTAVVVLWVVAAAVAFLVDGPRAAITTGIAFVLVALLVWRCVRRFGGATGDVLGAAVELCLAVLVVGFG